MKIIFSKKYKPLFELLIARGKVNENEYYKQLSKVDTVLLSGGRDSGKSFALACFNAIASKDYNHRILYTRQTMSSTDNSIKEALEERLHLIGYSQWFDYANNDYTCKNGIGKITITGQKTSVGTQTAKLKSIENYSIFETDEGEELESLKDWKKIKRSLRAKDVQCLAIISFNPPLMEHWLNAAFYEDVQPGFCGIIGRTLYIHTTYLDNGKENMAEHNWLEYEDLRLNYEKYLAAENKELLPFDVVKKYKEYKYDILGGFTERADGCVITNWETGNFDESLPFIFGLDFGSRDPDVLVKCAANHREKLLYVRLCFEQNNLGTNELIDTIKKFAKPNELIMADSSGRRHIRDLYDSGLNVDACSKVGGESYRIKKIQDYKIIVSPESRAIVKSFNNYVWKNKGAEIPSHDYSHIPHAIFYAFLELVR